MDECVLIRFRLPQFLTFTLCYNSVRKRFDGLSRGVSFTVPGGSLNVLGLGSSNGNPAEYGTNRCNSSPKEHIGSLAPTEQPTLSPTGLVLDVPLKLQQTILDLEPSSNSALYRPYRWFLDDPWLSNYTEARKQQCLALATLETGP